MTKFASRANHNRIMAISLVAVFVLALSHSAPIARAALKTPVDKYPRIANYYLRAGADILPSQYSKLAKYDLLIFPVEAQVYNSGMFARLRKLNPDIIILAYIPTKSWNDVYWTDSLHAKLRKGIKDEWWLKDSFGKPVSTWPGTRMLNATRGWGEYLVEYVAQTIMGSGKWDGVLYDEFSSTISWANNGDIDLDNDGVKDEPAKMDEAFREAMIAMLKETRELLGPDAVILTNGDSSEGLQDYVNGRMFESFPTPWEAGGTWDGVMTNYLNLHKMVGYTPALILNATAGEKNDPKDYQAMRFGLASTLLGDGYASFDFGVSNHGQLWYYDEYDAKLGKPVGRPINALADMSDVSWVWRPDHIVAYLNRNVSLGIWRRDFEHGIVLVNSSDYFQTVPLRQLMEHLRGKQAPAVNDGSLTASVRVPAKDGLILYKRLSKLEEAAYPNGDFVRVYGTSGEEVRVGFVIHDNIAAPQARILIKDIDGDGVAEKVVADTDTVSVYDSNGRKRTSFQPYGASFGFGIEIAAGDVDGDGSIEIVTGTGEGGPPLVKILDQAGDPKYPDFFAFSESSLGGVNVTVVDATDASKGVIVTGAGGGAAPIVRTFSHLGRRLLQFTAFASSYRGGVRVATGDVNGDGKMDIVAGAGNAPLVRTFSINGLALGASFFVGDPADKTGIRVAVTDVDGDGVAEIVVLTSIICSPKP